MFNTKSEAADNFSPGISPVIKTTVKISNNMPLFQLPTKKKIQQWPLMQMASETTAYNWRQVSLDVPIFDSNQNWQRGSHSHLTAKIQNPKWKGVFLKSIEKKKSNVIRYEMLVASL